MIEDHQRRVGAAVGHLGEALAVLDDEKGPSVTVLLVLDRKAH
jgi:hypothetical protein